MRTTVTVEPDVEALLQEAMRQTGQSFKFTLNQAIRKGLADTVPAIEEKPFVVRARPMRLRAGIDPTKLQGLADQMEVEAFLELSSRPDRARETPQ